MICLHGYKYPDRHFPLLYAGESQCFRNIEMNNHVFNIKSHITVENNCPKEFGVQTEIDFQKHIGCNKACYKRTATTHAWNVERLKELEIAGCYTTLLSG